METQQNMGAFREFQGRDLDDCISQAMSWYNCPRETLEIEIIQDAKSGIFGIVGARKAKIRAKRAHVSETVKNLLEGEAGVKEQKPSLQPESSIPPVVRNSNKQTAQALEKPAQHNAKKNKPKRPSSAEQPSAKKADTGGLNTASPKSGAKSPLQGKSAKPAPATPPQALASDFAAGQDDDLANWTETPLEQLDQNKIKDLCLEIVGALVRPLADREIAMNVDLGHGRPRIKIDWQGDAGILIGREGQTLMAIQYLASRMLSHAMGAALRVQLDIGDYRARQDGKLRDLAYGLAEQVRKAGRPLSTRPLSSYHRRLVHLCLQNETDLQTRSIGDGPLKRVLISPRHT